MYGLNLYGTVEYSTNLLSTDDIKNKSPNLMKYMPEYYQQSNVTKDALNSQSYEVGKLLVTIEDVEKQLYVDSATWGLDIWEDTYNIPTNLNATYEDRREVIKAKTRGQGTITPQMLKKTAEAFSGGEVDIIEHPEDDYFIIKFIGVKGIPRNMAGFIDMLEDIKPAHLEYDIQYSYTVWNVIEDKKTSWTGAKTNTWSQLKTYE